MTTPTVKEEWGMQCPKCADDNFLYTIVMISAHITPWGTDADGDQEWDQNSSCWCNACGWQGKVEDAKRAVKSEGVSI